MTGLSENLGRAYQRDPHAPSERNADEQPERGGFRIEAAEADAVRSGRCRAFGARRLQFGDISRTHVPLRIDWLDQIVADQSDHEHSSQNIKRVVVEVVTRHTRRELGFTDIVHHHRADNPGRGPCR